MGECVGCNLLLKFEDLIEENQDPQIDENILGHIDADKKGSKMCFSWKSPPCLLGFATSEVR
jgi:hypothetical protein